MDRDPKEKRRHSVAIDLDGTILHYTNWADMKGALGEPRPGAKEFLATLSEDFRIIIHTCKVTERPEYAKTIEAHLRGCGLPFDEIWLGLGKPIAEAYFDDRAVNVPKNPEPDDYKTALEFMRNGIKHWKPNDTGQRASETMKDARTNEDFRLANVATTLR